MLDDRPLLIASETEEISRLATSLNAELVSLPDLAHPETFEAWRATTLEGDLRESVIVSVWLPKSELRDLVELDADAWGHRFEEPYLLWNFALGAAAKRVADGGRVVAVCQAPAALDAPGRTPELAIADGVLSLVRSVAAAEGPRGVRANLVTTPIGLVEGDLIAPAPPLDGFPGTIETHVVGAVRTFLVADAEGVTGRVLFNGWRAGALTNVIGTDRKVIVVTGATGGVGRGIALACAEAGWSVWIAARREKEGQAVAAEVDARGGEGHFVSCDVGVPDSAAAAIATILSQEERLDGVVHNATSGLSPVPVSLAEVSLADFQDHVNVALGALHSLARASFEALKASQGSLLLMTSEAGFEGKAKLPPYAGVKGPQRGFARALAREWGRDGVRVNSIAPLASTPAMERAFELDPAMADRVLARNPLRRLGDPTEDIGRAARFLLSDDASYVTGHTLMVDGGSCPAV